MLGWRDRSPATVQGRVTLALANMISGCAPQGICDLLKLGGTTTGGAGGEAAPSRIALVERTERLRSMSGQRTRK